MPNSPFEAGAEGEVEIDDDLAHWIYAPTHSLLDSFCDVLDPKFMPMMKRGQFVVYDPRADRSKMGGVEQNKEDLIVLMELLPEFCFISKYNIYRFATFELTRGLGQMAITNNIPIWLVFATAMFLDIHHILREKLELGFQELQARPSLAKSQLDRYLSSPEAFPNRIDTWPKNNEKVFGLNSDELNKFILTGVVFPFNTALYKTFLQPAPDESERFYLYKQHPLLCGIQAFAVLL